jgi:hypothetical protein
MTMRTLMLPAVARFAVLAGGLFAATVGLAADAAPRSRGTNAFAAARPVSAAGSRFSGTVLERIPAGSYVYLRIQREDGTSSWVVTAELLAPDAARVRVHSVRSVDRFVSPRLKRTFSPLLFAIVRKETP